MGEYDIVVVVDNGVDFVIDNLVDNFVMDVVNIAVYLYLLNGPLFSVDAILHVLDEILRVLDDFLLLDWIHHDSYKLQRTHGIIPESILKKKKRKHS